MDNHAHDRNILLDAITDWQRDGLITEDTAAKLRKSVDTPEGQRQQLAQYFFVVAISSALLAFGALFIDEKLLETLRRTFLLQNGTIAVGAALLAGFWLLYVRRRKPHLSSLTYETYVTGGGLLVLVTLVYLCKEIGNGEAYSLFLGLAAIMLAVLSFVMRSRFLWGMFVLAAVGWAGAFTTVFSHNGRFLGLNYPARFTIFGVLVIGLSVVQKRFPQIADFRRMTYVTGLLIFFTGGWGMSVFGNYADWATWKAIRQTHVIVFAVLFGVLSASTLYAGIRREDDALRDYSILFLLLNLYTCYFEFFWSALSRGYSFLFLAVSFAVLGKFLMQNKKNTPGAG